MLELKAKLLSKNTKTTPTIKTVSFDICNPFIAKYGRIIELAYVKLNNLSNIFYSGGRSLFARLMPAHELILILFTGSISLDILILFIQTKT